MNQAYTVLTDKSDLIASPHMITTSHTFLLFLLKINELNL